MRCVRLLAGILAVAALSGCRGHGDARELLPDLDQAVPAAVELREEDGRRLLVFASAVDNVGAGPIEVHGSRAPGDGTMRLVQLVRRSDGSAREASVEGMLRYERAETHAHWHLLGFERYELRSPDGATVVTARKAGFCLGDRYDARRSVHLDGEPDEPRWTEECGRGDPGLRAVEEGISVGYGDDYAPYLEGQYVDVTGLPAGRYVLVHLANPGRALREASYGNNAASVALRLTASSVEILARCPDSAGCP
jgi:Lysyl oxidase